MKLKTLKDLERKANPDFVYSKELKAEAIKWVKELEKVPFDYEERGANDYNNGKIEILKEFFNITEEDLSQGMTQEVPK